MPQNPCVARVQIDQLRHDQNSRHHEWRDLSGSLFHLRTKTVRERTSRAPHAQTAHRPTQRPSVLKNDPY